MDIRKVKKLIELLEESGIAEIEIKEGEEAVRISRMPTGAPAPQYYAAPPPRGRRPCRCACRSGRALIPRAPQGRREHRAGADGGHLLRRRLAHRQTLRRHRR